MTASATAKLRARAERAERIAIGMGFLLLKLDHRFGGEVGEGMHQQMQQAIRDYRQMCREAEQRKHAAQINTDKAARAA